jgi:hypothetical protein
VVRLAWDSQNLYAPFDVQDTSPWQHEGKDYKRLFKTGDAVDVHLGPAWRDKPRRQPAAGDRRMLFAPLNGRPAAVLMAPVDEAAPAAQKVTYTSPVGAKAFDRVAVLDEAAVDVHTGDRGYRLEAAVPWSALGVQPKAGLTLRGDVGVIASDAAGRINVARTCWANPATNLVNDEPLEAWLYPHAWGELRLEEAP